MRAVRALLLAASLIVGGCAAPRPDVAPPTPGEAKGSVGESRPGQPVEAPRLGFFSPIKVPNGSEAVLRLTGRGVQVFRCEQRPDGPVWAFRLPEAELYNEKGELIARHGANFTFEHSDGSKLVGSVAAHEQVSDHDLMWLLLSTKSFGNGALAGVRYVQRVNTKGGMPPERCSNAQLNRLLRVTFSADFVFYRSQN